MAIDVNVALATLGLSPPDPTVTVGIGVLAAQLDLSVPLPPSVWVTPVEAQHYVDAAIILNLEPVPDAQHYVDANVRGEARPVAPAKGFRIWNGTEWVPIWASGTPLTELGDVSKATLPPANPEVNDIWLDLSGDQPTWNIWRIVDSIPQWVPFGGGGGGADGACGLYGDGLETTFDVQHNLNTSCVLAEVTEVDSGGALVHGTDYTWLILDDDTIRVVFTAAPAEDDARIVVAVGGPPAGNQSLQLAYVGTEGLSGQEFIDFDIPPGFDEIRIDYQLRSDRPSANLSRPHLWLGDATIDTGSNYTWQTFYRGNSVSEEGSNSDDHICLGISAAGSTGELLGFGSTRILNPDLDEDKVVVTAQNQSLGGGQRWIGYGGAAWRSPDPVRKIRVGWGHYTSDEEFVEGWIRVVGIREGGGIGSGGGSPVPAWVSDLATPSNPLVLWQDEFNAATLDSSWGEVLVSGTTDWAQGNGVLSARAFNVGNADANALMYPRTLAVGEALETVIRWFGLSGNYLMAGPIVSDGTDTTDGIVWVMPFTFSTHGLIRASTRSGSFATVTTPSTGDVDVLQSAFTYVRLIREDTNVWQTEYSPNGVHWTNHGQGPITRTLSPTHIGLAVSVWAGGAAPRIATFEYLRVYDLT